MTLRLLVSCFVFVFAALPSLAKDNSVTTFSLDNGMEIVVIEDHRAPVVTNMVWYKVGAADEPAGQSGIAHFLEHLMFKGTEKLKSRDFSDIVAANGGSDNAFTSQDYTGYYQRVAADRLELMIELEADRMVNLRLPAEEVLPERDVVLEERNQRVSSNPGSLFSEARSALQYLNHPYGIPVIGWEHEIAALTEEDAIAFYKTFYAPNNAILVVAGDVVPEQVFEMAKTYFGPLEPSTTLPPRIRPQEPPHLTPVRTIFEDARVRQPYVIRTYLAPSRQSGDQREAAAIRLFAELLGGSGVTSVMGRELQVEQKVALNTAAFYSDMNFDANTFGVYAVPAPGVSMQGVEDAMDEVIAGFLDAGIDEAHLARIKRQINASEIYGRDDQSGRARLYGTALTSGLTVQDVQEWPEILQSITPEEILAAGRRVLDLNNSVTGWLVSDAKAAKEGATQ